MKTKLVIIALISLLPLDLSAAPQVEDGSKDRTEVIQSEQGQYSVSVQPEKKRVEIKKIDGSQGAPPHLRVRMLRPNDRPLELRLKTVERVDSPIYYTGQFKQWNDSYVGLEIDFSFDKKTWKRLGKTLNKVVP